jgi:hypothetical protein
MNNLTIDDLILFLENLLGERLEALHRSKTLTGGEEILRIRLTELKALPEAIRGLPLATLLAETDKTHDAYGSALDRISRGLEELPLLSLADRAKARGIRVRFVPTRKVLTAKLPNEASHAKKSRPALAEFEADLKYFPLPNDKTLYDVADGFVTAGEKIDTLLSRRADAKTEAAQRAKGASLRTSAIRSISRARDSLDEELDTNPELSASLDGEIFGYLDVLIASRTKTGSQTTAARGAETRAPTDEGSTTIDSGA